MDPGPFFLYDSILSETPLQATSFLICIDKRGVFSLSRILDSSDISDLWMGIVVKGERCEKMIPGKLLFPSGGSADESDEEGEDEIDESGADRG